MKRTILDILMDDLLEMSEQELRDLIGDEEFEENARKGHEAVQRALDEYDARNGGDAPMA